MNRYLGSFFMTLFFYIVMSAVFIYLIAQNTLHVEKKLTKISLKNIEIAKQTEQPLLPKEEQIVEQEIQKKIEPPKQEIKKKTDLPRPQTQKETKQNNQNTPKPPEQPNETTQQPSDIQISQTSPMNVDMSQDEIELYVQTIKASIQKNIIYPQRARKMKIEGVVLLKIKILNDGKVVHVDVQNGHRLLQNATLQALDVAKKSFKIPPKELFITIPIEYKLK